MKSTYKMGLILLFSILLVSVYAGDKKDKVRQKIDEANQVFKEDMENGSYQKCLDYLAEDAIDLPSFAKMVRGKAEIEEEWKKNYEMGKPTKVKFETVEVIGEEKTFVEVGTYDMTFDMKNMDEPFSDVGKYVNVWELQPDGSIKLKAAMWNTDTNMMEGEMAGQPKSDEMTGGKK